MTLQSSGAISLSQVQTEFGGANPISMSEYYAGGANVPGATSGVNGAVPASGAISMSKFYGTADAAAFTPDGGTFNNPVGLEAISANTVSVTISCTQTATWTWEKSGTGGSASVSNGGSATSITFTNTLGAGNTPRSATFIVSATAPGRVRHWEVIVTSEGFA